MKPPLWKRLVLALLRPKYRITILVGLLTLASPLIHRAYVFRGIPDVGHPFDVHAFGTVELPDEENAYVEYADAQKLLTEFEDLLAGFDSEAYDKAVEDLHKVLDEGLMAPTPIISRWDEANRRHWRHRPTTAIKADFLRNWTS